MSVPHEPWYAAELARAAELPAGTLYPLLAQLERARWITGFWEPRDPLAPHRSPRRYYRLTVDGHDCAQEAFSNASVPLARPPAISSEDAPGRGRRARASEDAPGRGRRARAAAPLAGSLLLAARLRLSGRARRQIAGEWSAEVDHVLRRTPGTPVRRLAAGTRFAAGLFAAVPRVNAGAAARLAPSGGKFGVRRARQRLKWARRAWCVAAREHTMIDPELDPIGETVALHAALYCQLDVDDAQLAYGAACELAKLARIR
ncbi:MAG: PadR family transcriptional regulator, regulatory protein PadR [Cryptosporangiaceae bacterium]|jgi:DNA-binding PadR family transcriptional regulator|nr:PadR family transcriptional regulator, regulatory protein PadR [Cryptosporangiaceae bacterium]